MLGAAPLILLYHKVLGNEKVGCSVLAEVRTGAATKREQTR